MEVFSRDCVYTGDFICNMVYIIWIQRDRWVECLQKVERIGERVKVWFNDVGCLEDLGGYFF